jgi:hypothetical protein
MVISLRVNETASLIHRRRKNIILVMGRFKQDFISKPSGIVPIESARSVRESVGIGIRSINLPLMSLKF